MHELDNPRLSSIIILTHELVQYLHHAMVYELNYMLLLVGDHAGKIMIATWIKHDIMIKAAHQ